MTGLFSDVYYEVERDAEFVLRERGSKFYAYVFGVRSEAEVKEKGVDAAALYGSSTIVKTGAPTELGKLRRADELAAA